MEQLSALRQRLEGEQKAVAGQIKVGHQQYEKLSEQQRLRREARARAGQADGLLNGALDRLEHRDTSARRRRQLDAIKVGGVYGSTSGSGVAASGSTCR